MGYHCAVQSAGIRATRAPKRRRAAVMVEFAVVSPIFFLMVMGVIEFGRGLMVQQLLTNAARNGCRKAILGGSTTAAIRTSVTNEISALGIATTNAKINVYCAGNTGTALTATTSPGTEVTVQALVPVADISWLPTNTFLRNSLSGQFSMRLE